MPPQPVWKPTISLLARKREARTSGWERSWLTQSQLLTGSKAAIRGTSRQLGPGSLGFQTHGQPALHTTVTVQEGKGRQTPHQPGLALFLEGGGG